MKIKSKIEKALNKQANVEFNAFYTYLSMAAYVESRLMLGTAAWFKAQAQEEFQHATKINTYIMARGGVISLDAIAQPVQTWKSCLEVFEDAYKQEVKVSSLINDVMDLAKQEQDHATQIMLQWFITEQVEEEAIAQRNADKFKFIKESTEGIMAFDNELAGRK